MFIRKNRESSRDTSTTTYLEVKPRPGETPERMIKRFVKKVRNDGVLQEVYLRRHYEKPSQKKRRKQAKAALLRKEDEKNS